MNRFAARREEAGSLSNIDIRHQQPRLAVGLVASSVPSGRTKADVVGGPSLA